MQHSAAAVAPIFLLVRVFGITLYWIFLDEALSWPQTAGCMLIFIGPGVSLWPHRRA